MDIYPRALLLLKDPWAGGACNQARPPRQASGETRRAQPSKVLGHACLRLPSVVFGAGGSLCSRFLRGGTPAPARRLTASSLGSQCRWGQGQGFTPPGAWPRVSKASSPLMHLNSSTAQQLSPGRPLAGSLIPSRPLSVSLDALGQARRRGRAGPSTAPGSIPPEKPSHPAGSVCWLCSLGTELAQGIPALGPAPPLPHQAAL